MQCLRSRPLQTIHDSHEVDQISIVVGSPIQQGNNVKRYRAQATLLAPIVAEVLAECGWQATTGPDRSMLWSDGLPHHQDLHGAGADQWIYRFAGTAELGNKSLLALHLAHHRQPIGRRPGAPAYDFFPTDLRAAIRI